VSRAAALVADTRGVARRRLPRRWAVPTLAAAALLGAWEAGVRLGVVPAFFFPAPTAVLGTVLGLAADGTLLPHLGATLARTAAGSVLGCLPAALLGLVMGWSSRVREAVDPLVAALHPLPKIALLPLLMVIFGIGETSRVAAVAIGAFFPMLLATVTAVRQISPQHFEVVRTYGASRLQVLTRVVLPGSLPVMLTGLRLALNVALLITIAVELVTARRGLGNLIWMGWETMRTEHLYAGLVVIAGLGVLLNGVLGALSRWLVPWQARGDA
jgi:NitT/TauT family transport system permease protein